MITLELCPKGINSKDSIKCEYSHWKKKGIAMHYVWRP